MRHGVAGYKLGRDTEHRRAMFRNLAAAVFQHGQITTTRAKAKAVQAFVEKLITLGRRGDLAARRRAIALLRDRTLVHVLKGGKEERIEEKTLIQKLFDEIGPRYADRPGGYSRIVKLAKHRIGDGADLVVLQLVGEEPEGGPRVKGRYSRRRQIQNQRTAFAARLRRGARGGRETAAVREEEAQAGSEEAGEREPVPQPESSEAVAGEPKGVEESTPEPEKGDEEQRQP